MPVLAQIKFTQGATTAPAGEALIGAIDEEVVCSNGEDAPVREWTWEMLAVPSGSGVAVGTMTGGQTPTVAFEPDVSGCYLVQLTVVGRDGSTSVDQRVFAVPETSGRIIPPFLGAATAMNFGGQTEGWAPYVAEYLRAIDEGANGLITRQIAHSEGVALGDIVTETDTAGIYTLAEPALLESEERTPGGMVVQITTGVSLDTILVAIDRDWPEDVTGLDVDADGPGYVIIAADASLERSISPSDTDWVMGWLQPSGSFTLNLPLSPGLGSGGGGPAAYLPVSGTTALGVISSNISYDVSGGTTQVFTLDDGASEGVVHDLRAKGAPAGLVRVDAAGGRTIDGVASKYFRAIAAGLALQSLGGGNYESRMPPIPGITMNIQDFGAKQNGAFDDSDALNKAIAAVPLNGQVSNGQVRVYIPPCPNGTVLAKRIKVNWDNVTGYEGGFCLSGSASDSGATNYYGESFIYLAIPKREGTTVTVSGATTVGGRRYITIADFPANTFPDDETIINYRIAFSGCSNPDLDGRALVVKRNSTTSVDLCVPSTIGNGVTTGTWRVYDHAIDWHTQNSSIEYLYFQSAGAGYRYRSAIDITQSNGPGAQACSNNTFKCISSYGANIDYLFDMARSIVPLVGSPFYVSDGGRSRPYNPLNVDVMTFDACQANVQVGLLHCESLSKQSRLHRFIATCAALACESLIQATPVFSPYLDAGNWNSSISFTAEDCVADACTSYMFYLGLGQGAPIHIKRPIYEGVGGFIGFYYQTEGYHTEITVDEGYHYYQNLYIPFISPIIQAPKRLTLTNCRFWFSGSPPGSPVHFIEGHTGDTTITTGCSFPDSTMLGGGDVFHYEAGSSGSGFWRILEAGNSTYNDVLSPYYFPRRSRDACVPNPAQGFNATNIGTFGQELSGVETFSGTALAARNYPFKTIRLYGTASSFAIDWPIDVLEYPGDKWAGDCEVSASSAGAVIPAKSGQSGNEYTYVQDFNGSPGVNATTFTADATTDLITHAAHDFPDLSEVVLSNSGGALPTPLDPSAVYWTIRVSATTSYLASSIVNARIGNYIDITGAGTGTHTMTATEWVEYNTFIRRTRSTLTAATSLGIMREQYGRWKAGLRYDASSGSIAYWDSIAQAGGGPITAQSTFAANVSLAPAAATPNASFNNKYTYDCTAGKYFVNYLSPDIKSPRASVVFVGATDGGASRTMWCFTNAAGDNFIVLVRLNTIRMRCYVGGVYTTEIDSGVTPGSSPFVVGAVFDGANSRLYVSARTAQVTGTLDNLTLINACAVAVDFLGGKLFGYLCEVLFTFRNIPDAEMKSLMVAAGTEYAIQIGA